MDLAAVYSVIAVWPEHCQLCYRAWHQDCWRGKVAAPMSFGALQHHAAAQLDETSCLSSEEYKMSQICVEEWLIWVVDRGVMRA